jgi:hypothetical protein
VRARVTVVRELRAGLAPPGDRRNVFVAVHRGR